jgi:hypothetical protein
MLEPVENIDATPQVRTSFCSSIADERWHDLDGLKSFESWHFDAVSDDGREAIAIAFYDNYVLSPRFFLNSGDIGTSIKIHKFPAVSLVYAVNGKPVFNAVNEFVGGEFGTMSDETGCEVEASSFELRSADYGLGHFVKVDLRTLRGRRIRAELEWVFIESDLLPADGEAASAVWNIVAPRADVSGKIQLVGRRGKVKRQVNFRGTGYHDHVRSQNAHYRDLSSRMWGRAHFVDSTVIFERHGGSQNNSTGGKLYLVRDGRLYERNSICETRDYRRNRWGLRLPQRILYTTDDHIKLRVKPLAAFRSGFSEVKTLCEITLSLRDGKPRKTTGIVEFIDPRRMKHWLFRKISDLRIGRYGRPPLF